MKNLKKIVNAMIIVAGISIMLPFMAQAEEQKSEVTELNQVVEAADAVEAKEAPQENAKTVFEYAAGDTVLITGETKDGWYQVSFRDATGYIRKEAVKELPIETQKLDAEMEKEVAEANMIISEVERYRAESRRSKIWGTIIVLLVVGIFATGIFSTMRSDKEEKEKAVSENNKIEEAMKEDKVDVEALEEENVDTEEGIIDLDRE